MLEECKNTIVNNFPALIKECDVEKIKQSLIDKGVFSAHEISDIFSSDDARHNKRLFFFRLQKKDQRAFYELLECLKNSGQYNIVNLLAPKITAAEDTNNVEPQRLYGETETEPLNIKVIPSKKFLDTVDHNKKHHFYESRSKKRGKVLIINNYEYMDSKKYKYRRGALVDNKNLRELFNQMGGCDIRQYDNRTQKEMNAVIDQFAGDNENSQYDICFVIIMGHGEGDLNSTHILGIDGNYVTPEDIQDRFTNLNCRGFAQKPKVFLYQVCRGSVFDYGIPRTENDHGQNFSPRSNLQAEQEKVLKTRNRVEGDMLIGYATLQGYKAHRDIFDGSWYIELICKNFMTDACRYPLDKLLDQVDQNLNGKVSEEGTMQTSEYQKKAFKNLYLHPGIYCESGVLKYFHECNS